MRLEGYQLKDEIIEASDKFERDTGKSLNVIVENFIEEFLYKEKYLTIDISEEIQTPMEIYTERENNFTMKKQGNGIRLFYKDLDFSSHKAEDIEVIKSELLNFSDTELEELSKNNYVTGSKPSYKPFLYERLNLSYLLDKQKPKFSFESSKYISKDKRYDSKYRVRKNNVGFGTYSTFEDAKMVRNFLHVKDWDKKYSIKETGLANDEYREWIFHEIEKEGFGYMNVDDTVMLLGEG